MTVSLEAIIWYLFLLDSVGANVVTWFYPKWYKKNMNKGFVKHFPASKGWCLFYLVLVIWIGFSLKRLGVL